MYNFPKRYGQASTPGGAKVLPSLLGLPENSMRPWRGRGRLGVLGNILLCIALSREQTVEWEHRSPWYSLQIHVTMTARPCSCGLRTARNEVESQASRRMKFSRASVLETHTKAPGKF